MAIVTVLDHVTLDGVMQAPGRADEDPRDGFPYGGWEPPYGDAVMGETLGAGMAAGGALLLGRRTFEDLAASWGRRATQPGRRRTSTRCRSTWRRARCGAARVERDAARG